MFVLYVDVMMCLIVCVFVSLNVGVYCVVVDVCV